MENKPGENAVSNKKPRYPEGLIRQKILEHLKKNPNRLFSLSEIGVIIGHSQFSIGRHAEVLAALGMVLIIDKGNEKLVQLNE